MEREGSDCKKREEERDFLKKEREQEMAQIIVVGGGLAGLSAAHTALERGSKVVVLDKNPFCGGNSTKATSGLLWL